MMSNMERTVRVVSTAGTIGDDIEDICADCLPLPDAMGAASLDLFGDGYLG